MIHVFVDGAAGTTGLEIRERLQGRPDIAPIILTDDQRRDPAARKAALNDADFAILCLPDDAAREAVAMITSARTRVIDASTAHRVAAGWTYGLAELDADQPAAIATALRVSNPGCYPTGFLALVRPLVRAGLIPAGWPLSLNAISGYSGGGKAMIADFERGAEPAALRAYATGLAHKHVPEMQHHAGLAHPPIFAPSVARCYRGMIVEVPIALHALPGRPSLATIEAMLAETYQASPLVTIGATDELVRIEEMAGTDRLMLRVCGNQAAGQARLIATLDNLGKGAAGAAVHNLNIMAGLDPVAGLLL